MAMLLEIGQNYEDEPRIDNLLEFSELTLIK
jgi:hypothetical protein